MKRKVSNGSVITWVAIALGGIFIIGLLIYNANHKEPNKHTAGEPWNAQMVQGKMDAPNRIVEYTDYFCPYCTSFSEEIATQKFQDEYIKNGKVRLEARVVAVLESEFSPNAKQGAGAAYCAADQDKYWEYSDDIIPRIKEDFFDKGIGTKTAPVPTPIPKQPLSYFITSAHATNMDIDEFTKCMEEKEYLEEVDSATNQAIKLGIQGLPHIVINDYTSNGFQGGWKGLQAILTAGGVN